MKYKVGDIFVSNWYGVVTIIDYDSQERTYKCKYYNKIEIKDFYQDKTQEELDAFVMYAMYKYYPCVKL
jgi:hypothetical protein